MSVTGRDVCLGAALVAGLLTSTIARAEGVCVPPVAVSHAIRDAWRAEMVRLGPTGERVTDPLDTDESHFIGYRRVGRCLLAPVAVARLKHVFATRNLVSTAPGAGSGAAYAVGFQVAGESGSVRVALAMPAGSVEFELPNGHRTDAALSPAGMAEWRRLLAAIGEQEHRSPAEVEQELVAEMGRVAVAPAPDSSVVGKIVQAYDAVVPDEPAVPMDKVAPRYPDIARQAGVDGAVVLTVLVGVDGNAHDTRVTHSIPMLDGAARDAVMQWRFHPAKRRGQPVTSWLEVPVRFSLH